MKILGLLFLLPLHVAGSCDDLKMFTEEENRRLASIYDFQSLLIKVDDVHLMPPRIQADLRENRFTIIQQPRMVVTPICLHHLVQESIEPQEFLRKLTDIFLQTQRYHQLHQYNIATAPYFSNGEWHVDLIKQNERPRWIY